MEQDTHAAQGRLNAEQQTALGIVAHAALMAVWHSNPGSDWVAEAVRNLAWAETWLRWPYGVCHKQAKGVSDATV